MDSIFPSEFVKTFDESSGISNSTTTTNTTTTSTATTTIKATTTTFIYNLSTSDNKDEGDLYRATTIGIVTFGLLMMFVLTCYVVYNTKLENRRRRERQAEVKKEMEGDIPPTYSQIVMRQEPPEYRESVMQEINPEYNLNWSKDIVDSSAIHLEVKETVLGKVHSQLHGQYYNMLRSTDGSPRSVRNNPTLSNFVRDGMTDAELLAILQQRQREQQELLRIEEVSGVPMQEISEVPNFEVGGPDTDEEREHEDEEVSSYPVGSSPNPGGSRRDSPNPGGGSRNHLNAGGRESRRDSSSSGQSRRASPNPGQSTRASPNPEQSTRASPNPGQSTRASPNPGQSRRASPNPGGGNQNSSNAVQVETHTEPRAQTNNINITNLPQIIIERV